MKAHKGLFFYFMIMALSLCSQSSYAVYIEVTLLGTGTPIPNIKRLGPATVIEAKGQYFIFDVGRGAVLRLQQLSIPLTKIEHIFITHLHYDHTNGLSDLWLTSWLWQRQQTLQLYGPQGTKQLAKGLQYAYTSEIKHRSQYSMLNHNMAEIVVHEIEKEKTVYNKDGIKIAAFYVNHGEAKTSLGYRFELDERVIVISGDTTYSDNFIKHAQGADLIIHEVAAASDTLLKQNKRLQKVLNYHTTPQQIIDILKQTKPKVAILNHVLLFDVSENQVMTMITDNYAGDVYMGQDLLKIGIGNQITITPSHQLSDTP